MKSINWLTPSPQVYMFLDIVSGFQCLKSMQDNNDDCFDYEVQLCCPRKKLLYFDLIPTLRIVRNFLNLICFWSYWSFEGHKFLKKFLVALYDLSEFLAVIIS
jgi:hypothetical protein